MCSMLGSLSVLWNNFKLRFLHPVEKTRNLNEERFVEMLAVTITLWWAWLTGSLGAGPGSTNIQNWWKINFSNCPSDMEWTVGLYIHYWNITTHTTNWRIAIYMYMSAMFISEVLSKRKMPVGDLYLKNFLRRYHSDQHPSEKFLGWSLTSSKPSKVSRFYLIWTTSLQRR